MLGLVFVVAAVFAAELPATYGGPYSTTMLRTHHYVDGSPFLSIYEELSARPTAEGSAVVINIRPGFAFELSPGTVITRIRAVMLSSPARNETQELYYVYDSTGNEKCLKNSTSPTPSRAAEPLGVHTVRNLPGLAVWAQVGPDGTRTETTLIDEPLRAMNRPWVEEAVGTFVFRQNVSFAAGGGWLLDQGSHFTTLIDPTWFDVTPCSAGLPADPLPSLLGSMLDSLSITMASLSMH